MTNKEYFLKVINEEAPKFEKVVKALPEDQFGYRLHEKGRTAGSLAMQLASQPSGIAMIIKKGEPAGEAFKTKKESTDEMVRRMRENFEELRGALEDESDEDWETADGVLKFPGGEWRAKKYDMAWGFLFDAIHHRGQLTAYLRAMGAKVPGVYGSSADEG
ncbi:MAG: hypothetical protein KGJ13_04480 [Patescibacteria group bacterium]|nr:hypothetical protein [Patescibacteria group bacterium]